MGKNLSVPSASSPFVSRAAGKLMLAGTLLASLVGEGEAQDIPQEKAIAQEVVPQKLDHVLAVVVEQTSALMRANGLALRELFSPGEGKIHAVEQLRVRPDMLVPEPDVEDTKGPPLTPAEIEKHIEDLRSTSFQTRHAASTALENHFNEQVMLRAARHLSSPDIEQQRRVEQLLRNARINRMFEKYFPLPPHIEKNWLSLQGADAILFDGLSPCGTERWNFFQLEHYYLEKAEKRGAYKKANDYEASRWALGDYCRDIRNRVGQKLLRNLEQDLQKHQPQGDQFDWMKQYYRESMTQALQEAVVAAEPFVRQTKLWRARYE